MKKAKPKRVTKQRGTVVDLHLGRGFGFITADGGDGLQRFFHASGCLFPIENLKIGARVLFVPATTVKGERAISVEMLGDF